MPVVTFESFLELTLTTRLNKIPPCYYVEEDFRDVRIANITFSFDNSEMIKLLTERGVLVTAGKLDGESDSIVYATFTDREANLIVEIIITFENEKK